MQQLHLCANRQPSVTGLANGRSVCAEISSRDLLVSGPPDRTYYRGSGASELVAILLMDTGQNRAVRAADEESSPAA